jgi:lipoate-protein ligase A
VTYSFTAPIPHPSFPPSLLGAHKTIARALVEGLKEIGVNDAALVLRGKCDKDLGSFHSPSCLSSINHFEIEVQGAKLVGSAQRRTKRAFLQHGSILLGLERTLLNSLFKYTTDKNRSRSKEILDNKVITLAEYLGKDVTRKEVFQALKRGFSRILQGSWTPAYSSYFKLAGFKPNLCRVDSVLFSGDS